MHLHFGCLLSSQVDCFSFLMNAQSRHLCFWKSIFEENKKQQQSRMVNVQGCQQRKHTQKIINLQQSTRLRFGCLLSSQVDCFSFLMDALPSFSKKRLRKNKNNNQPSTINLRGKQKTTTIKDGRCARMPAKEKTKQLQSTFQQSTHLWMPVDDLHFDVRSRHLRFWQKKIKET